MLFYTQHVVTCSTQGSVRLSFYQPYWSSVGCHGYSARLRGLQQFPVHNTIVYTIHTVGTCTRTVHSCVSEAPRPVRSLGAGTRRAPPNDPTSATTPTGGQTTNQLVKIDYSISHRGVSAEDTGGGMGAAPARHYSHTHGGRGPAAQFDRTEGAPK